MEMPRTSLRRSSRAPLVIAILAVLAGAGFWASRVYLRGRAPPAVPPATAPAEAPAAEPAAGPAAGADAEARDLGPSPDEQAVRALAEAISPAEPYRRALAPGELPRRAAVLVGNLAEGASPRRLLGPLAPARPFTVLRRDGGLVIAPDAYARYQPFADTVAAVDARAAARAYRSLHTALEAAYRALGYPEASLDAVTGRALRRIAGAPVVDGEVRVVEREGLFVYEDERLERAGAVEKHLLRMGPRNTRLVQAKARELLEALGLPPSGAATPR